MAEPAENEDVLVVDVDAMSAGAATAPHNDPPSFALSWCRMPIGVLRAAPKGDLWVARLAWMLVVPAQFIVADRFARSYPFYGAIVIVLTWLFLAGLFRVAVDSLPARVLKAVPWLRNLIASIFLCWSGSIFLYAAQLQFPALADYLYYRCGSPGANNDPVFSGICGLASQLAESFPRFPFLDGITNQNTFSSLFVSYLITSAIFLILFPFMAALVQKLAGGDPTRSPAKADPPTLWVLLLTSLAMAGFYAFFGGTGAVT